jgi:hypothetical protein
VCVAEGQPHGWKWGQKTGEDLERLSDEEVGDGSRTRARACSGEMVVCVMRVLTSPADLTKALGMGRGKAVCWDAREDDVNAGVVVLLPVAVVGENWNLKRVGEPGTLPSSNFQSLCHCCTQQGHVARTGGTMVGIVTRKETPLESPCERVGVLACWQPRAESTSASLGVVLWRDQSENRISPV